MRGRDDLPRFLAPAAFLAVVTIAALLIRAGLHHAGSSTTTASTATQTVRTQTTTQRTTTRATTGTTASAGSTYTIQSGDTYAAIAARVGTSVQQLEQLNPGVSPNALRVGQQIRVK
jgi:LysM repeat protein